MEIVYTFKNGLSTPRSEKSPVLCQEVPKKRLKICRRIERYTKYAFTSLTDKKYILKSKADVRIVVHPLFI